MGVSLGGGTELRGEDCGKMKDLHDSFYGFRESKRKTWYYVYNRHNFGTSLVLFLFLFPLWVVLVVHIFAYWEPRVSESLQCKDYVLFDKQEGVIIVEKPYISSISKYDLDRVEAVRLQQDCIRQSRVRKDFYYSVDVLLGKIKLPILRPTNDRQQAQELAEELSNFLSVPISHTQTSD